LTLHTSLRPFADPATSPSFSFAFGDSYTANGYQPGRGFDPEVNQDIHTTSGGDSELLSPSHWNPKVGAELEVIQRLTLSLVPDWAQYLAAAADVEKSFYDFAISGSTVEPIHLGGNPRPNPSLVNETDVFINYFVDKNDVQWAPETTLFSEFEEGKHER